MRSFIFALSSGVMVAVALSGCVSDSQYQQDLVQRSENSSTNANTAPPYYYQPSTQAAAPSAPAAASNGYAAPTTAAPVQQQAFTQPSQGALEEQRTAELLAQQQMRLGPLPEPDYAQTGGVGHSTYSDPGLANQVTSASRCLSFGSNGRSVPIMCSNQLTHGFVRELQRALKSQGFSPGPIDGVYGRHTHAALSAYEKAQNLPTSPGVSLAAARSLGLMN